MKILVTKSNGHFYGALLTDYKRIIKNLMEIQDGDFFHTILSKIQKNEETLIYELSGSTEEDEIILLNPFMLNSTAEIIEI